MFSGIILHALASSEINSIAASYPVSKRANHAVLEARFENAPWAKHNESVLLTTYGCDYGYVEWKISTTNILGHSLDPKRQITQTGPGFYKARCKEDFMVNSDWVTVYVELDGSIVPVISGPNSLCPNTAATVTTAGCPSGYYNSWSTLEQGGFAYGGNSVTVYLPQTVKLRCIKNDDSWGSDEKPFTIASAIPDDIKATSNNPVVSGGTALLNGTTITGATYQWTPPAGVTLPVTNTRALQIPNITTAQAGEYKLKITSGGCVVEVSTRVDVGLCDNLYIKAFDPTNGEEKMRLNRKPGQLNLYDDLVLQVETFEGEVLKGVEYTWTLPQGVTVGQDPAQKHRITINKIGNYKVNVTSTGGVSCPLEVDISALACATPEDFLSCGSTATVSSTGTEKLKNLVVGDIFSTYDYIVSVTEVSGNESSGWTGRGYIEMNFLKLGPAAMTVPLAVKFEKIQLNQCYQLLAGSKVITEFDENWNNVLSVSYIADRLTAIYGEIKDILTLDPENKEALEGKINELKSIKVELGNFGFSPEYLLEQTTSLNGLISTGSCYVGSPGARSSNSCSSDDVMAALDEAIEDPVKPLNALQKAWNIFLSNYHINRAYAFAAANNIDEADIYETSYDWIPTIDKNTGLSSGQMGTSMQVIVYQLKKDANGNNIELKHVFRQHKKGVHLLTSSDNDDLNLQWDNYWTEEGEVILNESDLSEPITDVSAILPIGGTTKVAAGVKLAGSTKTWSVYTFLTTTGRYYGLTVDYTRRIAQHGARVIGGEEQMIKRIPDKLTARGIEQLFINYGVKKKTITKQINSINPKRKERYAQALEQAEAFLKKNYGDTYKYLYE